MKKIILLALLLMALLYLACEDSSNPVRQVNKPDKISLATPQIGQVSRYVRFYNRNYWSRIDTIRLYSTDTLVVEILGVNGDTLLMRDSISAGSRSFRDAVHADSQKIYRPSHSRVYQLIFGADSITFAGLDGLLSESHLFALPEWTFLSGSGHLPSNALADSIPNRTGWKTFFCECRSEGYLLDYPQSGKIYDRLNVVVENTPMRNDLLGHTYLYSREHGVVHMFHSNLWTGTAHGWQLLD